jgi:hypothetical protein
MVWHLASCLNHPTQTATLKHSLLLLPSPSSQSSARHILSYAVPSLFHLLT